MLLRVTELLILSLGSLIALGSEQPPSSDWPQRRGPNRDGVVVRSPKLMDTWPKEGPPLVWKSAWIPGYDEGGCGDPVVADGRVFIYANAKPPEGSSDGYQFITNEFLESAGWLPELPEDLSRKVEDAWASKERPNSIGWPWYKLAECKKEGALDAFLAKKPELSKYIQDFLATLKPEDAKKYGDYIRKRLCISCKGGYGIPRGIPWEKLIQVSKMRDVRYRTRFDWDNALKKVVGFEGLCDTYPNYDAWKHLTNRSDTIFCLDAATGKTLWQKDFPCDPAVIPLDDAACALLGSSGTPAVEGDRCFVSGAMGVYCLSVKDGTMLWHAKGGFAHSALLITDGVVYDNGRGCAYSAEDGALLWKNTLRSAPGRFSVREYDWNMPVLWKSGGKNYIIAHDGGRYFACIEPKTGQALWTMKVATGWFPTVHGDTLVMPVPWPSISGGGIPKQDTGTKLYQLTPAGPELIWRKGFQDTEGDVTYQDHLYMVRQCVDLKTGEVNWKDKVPWTVVPPILADGKVIGLLEGIRDGWIGSAPILMFKATPESYIELGKFSPGACFGSTPAFSDGKLFVRLLDSIACYDLREHGIYLGGVAATKDTLTFQFKQTGGGLTASNEFKGARITDAGGAVLVAPAKLDGDNIVVDIKDASTPFSVSCPASNTLSGRNGKPVPAFGWSTARSLKIRKCLDRDVLLESGLPLLPEGDWNKAGTYTVSGAKVLDVTISPNLMAVKLGTDKSWKPGDTLTLTYAHFPVEQGEPRRETLKYTAVENQKPDVAFVRIDETTAGNWKGVYGKDGAAVAGDKAATGPPYATVSLTKAVEATPWAANPKEERYLQKSGEAQDRTVKLWTTVDQCEIALESKDGKEHQVAVYGFPWGAVQTVEILDPDTRAALDVRVLEFKDKKGKYTVWRIKGSVVLRLLRTTGGEFDMAAVGGVFFDPPDAAAK